MTNHTTTGHSPGGLEWRIYHDKYSSPEKRNAAIEQHRSRLAALWRPHLRNMRGQAVQYKYARTPGWGLYLVVGPGRAGGTVRARRVPRYCWGWLSEEQGEERFRLANKTVQIFQMHELVLREGNRRGWAIDQF